MKIKKSSLIKLNNYLIRFFLPPDIYLFLINILDKCIIYFTHQDVSLNKYIKDYQDEVYILGNGPSLNEIDLSVLENKHCITMNFFHRHPISSKIKPIFHVMADPVKDKKKYSVEHKIAKKNTKEILSKFNTTYILHNEKKIWHGFFLNKNIYYFRVLLSRLDQFNGSKFCFDKAIPRPNNSVQLAIMLAIYLGYKKIYLLGVDENQLTRSTHYNEHFYEQTKEETKLESSERSYLTRLKGKITTFSGFETLLDVSKQNDIQIYNLNKSSFLDVFDFKSFRSKNTF